MSTVDRLINAIRKDVIKKNAKRRAEKRRRHTLFGLEFRAHIKEASRGSAHA